MVRVRTRLPTLYSQTISASLSPPLLRSPKTSTLTWSFPRTKIRSRSVTPRSHWSLKTGNRIAVGVLVADTIERRVRGLMFRTSTPPNRGMLFAFPVATTTPFWNQNTPQDLDIAFLGPDGTIQEILTLSALDTVLVYAEESYHYAVEMPRGWFQPQRRGARKPVRDPRFGARAPAITGSSLRPPSPRGSPPMLDLPGPRLMLRQSGDTLPRTGSARKGIVHEEKFCESVHCWQSWARVGRFLMGRRRHEEEEI